MHKQSLPLAALSARAAPAKRMGLAPLAVMAALAAALVPPPAASQVISHAPAAANPAGPAAQRTPPSSAPGLTLAEATHLALQHSPALHAAQLEWQASEGALAQAGAWLNPELQAWVEDSRPSRTTTLQWAQPVELGGQRAARLRVAQLAQAQLAVELQARRAQVRADVAQAYFALALAQERSRLAEATLALAEQAAAAVDKRVFAGKVSPVEASRAQVAQAAARLELRQAQGEERMARQGLAALLGLMPSALPALLWQPAAELAQAGAAEVATRLAAQAQRLAGAPALQVARLEASRRQAEAALEQAKRNPILTLTLGAKQAPEQGRTQALLGLSMPLPLWDRNQGQLSQALRLAEKAEADLQATQQRLNTEWSQLCERYSMAHAEVQILQTEVLPSAQAAWQAAVTGFELGRFSFLETLDAQRSLFQARAQQLHALGELHRLAAEMARLLGDAADELDPQ